MFYNLSDSLKYFKLLKWLNNWLENLLNFIFKNNNEINDSHLIYIFIEFWQKRVYQIGGSSLLWYGAS